jgi:hypothetical protein
MEGPEALSAPFAREARCLGKKRLDIENAIA